MPSSAIGIIDTVLRLIMRIDPQTILDVGCGMGTYGVLMREFLDVYRDGVFGQRKGILRQSYQWSRHIEAVEVWEPYVRTPLCKFVYDKVHVCDGLSFLERCGPFDLILMVNVLEHNPKQYSRSMLRAARAKSGHVVLSVPVGELIQHGTDFGNPWEEHRSAWTLDDFLCPVMAFEADGHYIVWEPGCAFKRPGRSDWEDRFTATVVRDRLVWGV